MVTVLQKKFLVQWSNFHDFAATVFPWMNQEICMSSFRQGKYRGSKFRGLFSCIVTQAFDCHIFSKKTSPSKHSSKILMIQQASLGELVPLEILVVSTRFNSGIL